MIRERFEWSVRVYYEDTDAGGVVYYANYLKFFERARSEAIYSMGFSNTDLKNKNRPNLSISNIKEIIKILNDN